ncbi:MAG: hypothetical protein Q4A24_03515 [Akkermansia sp.]|nr:hypothetical protein [Akkermansia sp.]
MKLRLSIIHCLACIAASASVTYAADELPPTQPCIYNFPKGDIIQNNIATFLPSSRLGDYSCTLIAGSVASVNGVLSADASRGGATKNGRLSILVKDEFTPTYLTYVSHLSLGSEIFLKDATVAVHSESCLPTRLNVSSSFLPGCCVNFSGGVQADISDASFDGVKIYSAGATILNDTVSFGKSGVSEGGYFTWEIAGPTTMVNDHCISCCTGFSSAVHGQVSKVAGGFIFNAETENNSYASAKYSTVTVLGDMVTPCPKVPTRHVVFYTTWEDNGKTVHLPDDGAPLFICNSIDPALPPNMVGFTLNKQEGADMSPLPATFNLQYRNLSTGTARGRFDAALHPDGRVRVAFYANGGSAINPLADAKLISDKELYSGATTLYRLMPGGELDMTEAGDEITLDNITAGTLTHGAGIVHVDTKQHITISGDKTIRHAIKGAAKMTIQGKRERAINVAFERLLQPDVDKTQALYELKNVHINHATVYIGPGNIVGSANLSKASVLGDKNADIFNYGVLNADVRINKSSRLLNSHYAGTSILKHKGCNDSKIRVDADSYPGTISGSVLLNDAAEFCNYGTVHGDISVGPNSILYGCGTCLGTVSVAGTGMYYVDHSIHRMPIDTGFSKDIITDSNIKRPGNSCKYLNLTSNATLGFRVAYPDCGSPNVLLIEKELRTSGKVFIRADIDGSIVNFFSGAKDTVLIPLARVVNPKKGAAFNKAKLVICSGGDLLRDAKLVWNKKTGTLSISAKLNMSGNASPAKRSRRSR